MAESGHPGAPLQKRSEGGRVGPGREEVVGGESAARGTIGRSRGPRLGRDLRAHEPDKAATRPWRAGEPRSFVLTGGDTRAGRRAEEVAGGAEPTPSRAESTGSAAPTCENICDSRHRD